ncbi:MAG TPA: redoxin family protein [Puia sp.]|nr:redoxin family protein [Puia sp.]
MTKLFAVVCFCIVSLGAAAQPKSSAPRRALHIGDTVPDVTISHISQYGHPSAHFAAFRGKWVILDFWLTGCAGCIESFPRMKQLSDEYSDRLQIVLVNTQPEAQIRRAFERMHARHSPFAMVDLPSVTGDTVFGQLFPHMLVPHEVWIDGQGVVRAITHAQDVTSVNIDRLLADSRATLPEKIDFLTHDPLQPLLPQIYPVDPGVLRYSSSLFGYFEGLRGPVVRIAIDSVHGAGRITRPNYTIPELIGEAVLGRDPSYNSNIFKSADFDFGKRIELITRDTAKYLCRVTDSKDRADWDRKHRFSYESVFPLDEQDYRYRVMLQTLSDYFHLSVKVERRRLPCVVLVRTSDVDRLKASPDLADSLVDPKRTQLYHAGIGNLLDRISFANRNTPLIFKDETGYSGAIEMELSAPLNDLAALAKELRQKYDLDLVEKTTAVDVLVIKDY